MGRPASKDDPKMVSVRLGAETRELLDKLAEVLTEKLRKTVPGLPALSKTAVIELAVRQLADRELK